MKKFVTFIAFALSAVTAGAQYYYQDCKNSEMLRHGMRHEATRKEVVLPGVNGYNVCRPPRSIPKW